MSLTSEVGRTATTEGDCRACGATNDLQYTYCRNCVAQLPDSSDETASTPQRRNGPLSRGR